MHYALGSTVLVLARPSHYHLPMRDFSFRPLFECASPRRTRLALARAEDTAGLDVTKILRLVCHFLAERKIVLISRDVSLLTPVAEALRALLFPLQARPPAVAHCPAATAARLQWQFAFVPVLPAALAYVLRAPVPLLAGMHRDALSEMRLPEEAVLVDLDHNLLTSSSFVQGTSLEVSALGMLLSFCSVGA